MASRACLVVLHSWHARHDVAVRIVRSACPGNYVVELTSARADVSKTIEACLVFASQQRREITAVREEVERLYVDGWIGLSPGDDSSDVDW